MNLEKLEQELATKAAEEDQRIAEQTARNAAAKNREARVAVWTERAEALMGGWRQLIADMSPVDDPTQPVPERERYSDEGKARQAALDESVSIMVDLGPVGNPESLRYYMSDDGHVHALISAGGYRWTAGRHGMDRELHRGTAMYGTVDRITEVTIMPKTKYTDAQGDARECQLSFATRSASVNGLLGFVRKREYDYPERDAAASDESVAEFEASAGPRVIDAEETLAMVRAAVTNPELNPELAARIANRQAARMMAAAA